MTRKELLEKELANRLNESKHLQHGTDEHTNAVNNIETLHKMILNDEELEDNKKSKRKDRVIKVIMDGLTLTVPLAFYSVWMNKGLKFEETGIFTSTTFKGLISKFRPTK